MKHSTSRNELLCSASVRVADRILSSLLGSLFVSVGVPSSGPTGVLSMSGKTLLASIIGCRPSLKYRNTSLNKLHCKGQCYSDPLGTSFNNEIYDNLRQRLGPILRNFVDPDD